MSVSYNQGSQEGAPVQYPTYQTPLNQGSLDELAYAGSSFCTTHQNDRELFNRGAAPSKIDDEFWGRAELTMSTEPLGGRNWWEIWGRLWAIVFYFWLRPQAVSSGALILPSTAPTPEAMQHPKGR